MACSMHCSTSSLSSSPPPVHWKQQQNDWTENRTDVNIRNKFRSQTSTVRRLATYKSWKTKANSKLTKSILSRLGFSYTGIKDRLKCDACQIEIESWTSDMDPCQEHLQRSPQCPFILNNPILFKRKDQIEAPTPMETDVPKALIDSYLSLSVGEYTDHEDPLTSEEQYRFLRLLSPKKIEQLRANTFSNWPLITPSTSTMVSAGWWYTNISDRVICIHCHAVFHKWTPNDQPYEIHCQKSPMCPFVQMNEKHKKSENHPAMITEPQNQLSPLPVHMEYSSASQRLASFATWPHTHENPLPSVDLFVSAGFFYTGEATIVRCFHCNGALRNWQSNDEPKIEHARWYAHCQFIREVIGEDLYEAIQRKKQQLQVQQTLVAHTKNADTSLTGWPDAEIERMTKARLDMPIVEKLRKLGYRVAIIRKAIEMQLKLKKDDFKSDDDLLIAYFILDQQIRLINGNDKLILVPSTWLHEEKENPPPLPAPAPPKTLVVTQSPVIKPISSPSSVISRDMQNDMLCILCASQERQMACLPCGHLTSCAECGKNLRTCPLCQGAVKSLIRIYL